MREITKIYFCHVFRPLKYILDDHKAQSIQKLLKKIGFVTRFYPIGSRLILIIKKKEALLQAAFEKEEEHV
jgi:hypothetical protein